MANNKSWYKFTFSIPVPLTEPCAAFLGDLSGNGVEIITDEGNIATVIMYLSADNSLPAKRSQLSLFLAAQPSTVTYKESLIKDEDWNKQWKQHFKPEKFTEHLVIKPTWEPYTAGPDEVVIEMDPGMAFGTGHHASTRLMLSLIETTTAPGQHVLDIGTGTGILAMAATLFGAAHVVALDNDPDAVDAARTNVAMNNLQASITVSGDDLTAIKTSFDLVLANIIYNTLMDMAKVITDKVSEKGLLALSGILKGGQEKDILNHYEKFGFTAVRQWYADEWVALLLKKQ